MPVGFIAHLMILFIDSFLYIGQGILADALKCLGDNKKVVRESVVKMLDSWVLVVQLDKMVSFNALL